MKNYSIADLKAIIDYMRDEISRNRTLPEYRSEKQADEAVSGLHQILKKARTELDIRLGLIDSKVKEEVWSDERMEDIISSTTSPRKFEGSDDEFITVGEAKKCITKYGKEYVKNAIEKLKDWFFIN